MQIIDLKDKGAKDIFSQDKCAACRENFILNRYMVQHGLFSFHLTCFKKYGEKKITEWVKEIDMIREDIKKLSPYHKEMICESFLKEKYG